MRVAINCRSFLKKQYTGIGRYAYHLVKSLNDIDCENEYHLYARKELFSFNKKLPSFYAKNFVPRIDRFNHGPAKVLKDIDVYHIPSPGSMEAPSNAKIVMTVHDLIFKAFPEGHTQQTIEAGQKQFTDIAQKASKIICCSKSTIDDLQKYFQIPSEKITLIYQGVDKSVFYRLSEEEDLLANKVLKERGIGTPYIFSVGTIEPRKNLINLIHAFHKLKAEGKFVGKLVIAGMTGWMNENMGTLVDKLELTKHVVFLGYLSDQELCYFYNKARVFVFPSFYEGFGFPIVEAFCCHVPVVTSNVSSCPEIAGDAALTIDPHSPDEIAEAIDRILSDHDFRDFLKKKGIERAEQFDFRKTAHETLSVYNEVYNL